MYFLLRLSPLLSSLIGYFVLDSLRRKSLWLEPFISTISTKSLGLFLVAVLVFFLVLLTFIGAGYPLKNRLRFFPYLAILWLSGTSYFFLIDDQQTMVILSLLLPVLSWIWLESLFLFWQRSHAYQAYTLQRIANYCYLIVLFLVFVSLSAFQSFLQLPFWIVLILGALASFTLTIDLFFLHKIPPKDAILSSALITFFSVQLFAILHLLPTQFMLYGLIMMLLFYVWNGVFIQLYKEHKRLKQVGLYVATAGIGSMLILFFTLFWN